MSIGRDRSPRFEEVLDACIDDIAAGRRTVQQCLAAWPQFREQLAAVLDAASALHALPRVPARSPEPARRAQLMAQLRDLPQEPRLEALPEPASEAAKRAGVGWIATPLRGVGWIATPLLAPLRAPLRGVGWLFASAPRAGAFAVPAAAAAALAVLFVLASGSSSAHAATLTVFGGAVERSGASGWSALDDGSAIEQGDRLRTSASGRALLTFADGSTVALDPETELSIALLRVDGPRRITLVQDSGRLWNDVAPGGSDASYIVETPDAVVTAHGTLFETVVHDGATDVTTEAGEVEVVAGRLRALVQAGHTTTAQARRILQTVRERQAQAERTVRLSVDAPFTASLIDPQRAITGASPDGLVYQQIRGAVTTNPGDGAQLIVLHRPQDGTYELLLRRVESGSGVVLVRVGDREVRIPVDAIESAVRVRLTVASVNGDLEITPEVIARATKDTLRDFVEHSVVAEQARDRAVPVAEQLARLRAAQDAAGDDSAVRPTAAPSSTPEPSATEPAARDATATSDRLATATRTATPTRTPRLSDVPARDTLEEAVEHCLAGVRSGAVTLAECRARWSEYADRLEALVRRLQALQDEITVEQALLFCLRHIEAGELTPEGCPQHFPWLAEDLKPLFREALGGTDDATTTDPPADAGTDTTADTATAEPNAAPTAEPTAKPTDSLDSATTR